MVSDVVGAMPALVPRGGYAMATLIAAMWAAVIAAMVAMEKNRHAIGWAAAAFVLTPVIISTALFFAAR